MNFVEMGVKEKFVNFHTVENKLSLKLCAASKLSLFALVLDSIWFKSFEECVNQSFDCLSISLVKRCFHEIFAKNESKFPLHTYFAVISTLHCGKSDICKFLCEINSSIAIL